MSWIVETFYTHYKKNMLYSTWICLKCPYILEPLCRQWLYFKLQVDNPWPPTHHCTSPHNFILFLPFVVFGLKHNFLNTSQVKGCMQPHFDTTALHLWVSVFQSSPVFDRPFHHLTLSLLFPPSLLSDSALGPISTSGNSVESNN